jgi:hypothetical protein
LAGCSQGSIAARIAKCQVCGVMSSCVLSTPRRATSRLREWGGRSPPKSAGSTSTPPQPVAEHGHLVFGGDDRKIGLPFRHQGAKDPFAEADVARDRAAALAHSVDLGLFHIPAPSKGRLRNDVGRGENTLATQTGDHDVDDIVDEIHLAYTPLGPKARPALSFGDPAAQARPTSRATFSLGAHCARPPTAWKCSRISVFGVPGYPVPRATLASSTASPMAWLPLAS